MFSYIRWLCSGNTTNPSPWQQKIVKGDKKPSSILQKSCNSYLKSWCISQTFLQKKTLLLYSKIQTFFYFKSPLWWQFSYSSHMSSVLKFRHCENAQKIEITHILYLATSKQSGIYFLNCFNLLRISKLY